jgi:hypothetical protein
MTKKEVLEKLFEKKLKAFARLAGLAEKYNEGWIPDWTNEEENKYYIGTDFDSIQAHNRKSKAAAGVIYFKTEELAEKAITNMIDAGLVDFLFDAQTYFIDEHEGEFYLTTSTSDVINAAKKLVKDFGSTTNLDIKNFLRSEGHWITQDQVSAEMDNVDDSDNLRFSTNGIYRTWYAK